MRILVPIAPAWAAEAEHTWGFLGGGNAVGYLLLALMLALLLLLRVHRREEAQRRPRPRPQPHTLEELGILLVKIAHKGDLEPYRALFLAGGEIARALGAEADRYLAARSNAELKQGLAVLARRVPEGAAIETAYILGRDTLALKLSVPTGVSVTTTVGTVAEVDGIWRLVHPAVTEKAGAPSKPRRTR